MSSFTGPHNLRSLSGYENKMYFKMQEGEMAQTMYAHTNK
jgi:hypothetical protein